MKGEALDYEEIFAKLERERGFQGGQYRPKCLRRRIAVRMRARGISDLTEYCKLLDHDPVEYDRLLRELTINVSKFFRNPETWAVIRNLVVPELLKDDGPIRVWSAGTAAGEEAYSMAIALREALPDGNGKEAAGRIRVLGTDIDATVLKQARAAEYPDEALSETPAETRRRWFSDGPPYRLEPDIRSLVEFRQLDILDGAPGFEADLVLCRNLLIYLESRAQKEVFRTFADVLRPDGFLVLGRVETLGRVVRKHFDVIDVRERIYRRK